MANAPAALASSMRANSGCVPNSLLDLQLASGLRLYVADGTISAFPQVARFDVGDPVRVTYKPSLVLPPAFTFTGSLQTPTASVAFQNFSGNTVQRDGSLLFSREEFWGALFVYRLYQAEAEFSLLTVIGNVSDADVDDDVVNLSLKSMSNWSEIVAPDCQINENCQNTFGTQQCGSTSPTPCQNTYGSCTQLNRFKGVVSEWNTDVIKVGTLKPLAQPQPLTSINLRRRA